MNSDTSSERSITIKRSKRASHSAATTKKEQQTKRATAKGSSASQARKGEGASKGATPSSGVRKSKRTAAKDDVSSMVSHSLWNFVLGVSAE